MRSTMWVLLFALGCQDQSLRAVNSLPTADILAPADGSTVLEGRSVTLTGEVRDPGSDAIDLSITWTSSVDGLLERGAPEADGVTTSDVSLHIGKHVITLSVVDLDGGDATDSITVDVIDDLPPTLAIVSPGEEDLLRAGRRTSLEVLVGDAEDSVTELEVWWTLDEDEDLAGPLVPGADGFSSASATLTEGPHRLRAHVRDTLGQEVSREIIVDVGPAGQPPACGLVVPATDVRWEGPGPFGVEVSSADVDDGPGELTVELSSDLDGPLGGGSPDGGGRFSASVALSRGVHQLTATVVDGDGDVCTASRQVTTSLAPTVRFESPSPGQRISAGETLLVRLLSADEDEPVTGVQVELDAGGATFSGTPDATGAVSFALDLPSGAQRLVATVVDGLGFEGTASRSVLVNSAPVATDPPTIAPTPLLTNQDATCVLPGGSDADGDTITWTYGWEVDSTAVANTTDTLSSSATTAGSVVRCFVTPSDGTDTGAARPSAPVTVGAAAPSRPVVRITPASPRTQNALNATLVTPGVDPDGASVVHLWSWRRDGVAVPAHSGSQTVPSVAIRRDETWTVAVVAESAVASSAPGTATVVIGNTPPVVNSVTITPDPAFTHDELTAIVSSSDRDQDPVSVSWQWRVNGTPAGTAARLQGSAFDKGDQVTVTGTPFDGTDSGTPVTSATLVIGNSPPTAPDVRVGPAGPIEAVDDLLCRVFNPSTDPDGDPLTYEVGWMVDGTPYPRPGDHGPSMSTVADDTVDRRDTTAGEAWTCWVSAFDDDLAQGDAGSDSVVVSATAPSRPVYDGTYDLSPAISYRCTDVFFGLPALTVSINSLTFDDNATRLRVVGAPVTLTESPPPAGTSFSPDGVVAGACRETYTLAGNFSDADTWAGLLTLTLTGGQCGLTTCTNQSWSVTGTRR